MTPGWEEGEFVFCDLQTAARYIRRDNDTAAEDFVRAVYDTFEFLARNPGIARRRIDLGFPELRSWRVKGFRRYLIFYRELPRGVQIWRVLHGTRDLGTELS
jgi:toxin ParE1/3/4